jgi:hypothetical protein
MIARGNFKTASFLFMKTTDHTDYTDFFFHRRPVLKITDKNQVQEYQDENRLLKLALRMRYFSHVG